MTESEKFTKLAQAVRPLVQTANMYNHIDFDKGVRVSLSTLRQLRDVYEEVTEHGPRGRKPL